MKDEATKTEIVKHKITKGTTGTPTTRAGRRAKAGQSTLTKAGVAKKARSTGSYGISGSKVTILPTADKHKLWADLFSLTESQINSLKQKVSDGIELDHKDMSKLDSCYGGMKKLLEIESTLKSDAIASLSTEELMALAKKAIREAEARAKALKNPVKKLPVMIND
tara:strand:+ start:187 stop:684 length:498 start_codon:yes stop_codon:yes gene_type:complete